MLGRQGQVHPEIDRFVSGPGGEIGEPRARHHRRAGTDRTGSRQLDEGVVGALAERNVVDVEHESGHAPDGSATGRSDVPSRRGERVYDRAVELRHLPADTDPAVIADHLRTWGYAIVDDVVDDATLDRLAAEAAPYVDSSATGRDGYDGRQTRRTGALMARCPTARELVMHPVALGTVGHLLGHATTFQLHLTQIISIGPGEQGQQLHRDQMAFDFFPFPADYHAQCNTMWALTDFTEANGGTRVVPDRRVSATRRPPTMPVAAVEMRARQRALLRGQGVARGRRQRQRRHPSGRQPHVRRRLGPPGGEPVPRLPTRDRPHPRRRSVEGDGLPGRAPSHWGTSATSRIRWRCCGASTGPSAPSPSTTSAATITVASSATSGPPRPRPDRASPVRGSVRPPAGRCPALRPGPRRLGSAPHARRARSAPPRRAAGRTGRREPSAPRTSSRSCPITSPAASTACCATWPATVCRPSWSSPSSPSAATVATVCWSPAISTTRCRTARCCPGGACRSRSWASDCSTRWSGCWSGSTSPASSGVTARCRTRCSVGTQARCRRTSSTSRPASGIPS